jgi:hypothetical protein
MPSFARASTTARTATSRLWIHDELVTCCRLAIAEQVGEILVRHAREAGTRYGFRVPLDAEFKIGRDWAGTPLDAHAAPATAITPPPIPADEKEVCYVDDF